MAAVGVESCPQCDPARKHALSFHLDRQAFVESGNLAERFREPDGYGSNRRRLWDVAIHFLCPLPRRRRTSPAYMERTWKTQCCPSSFGNNFATTCWYLFSLWNTRYVTVFQAIQALFWNYADPLPRAIPTEGTVWIPDIMKIVSHGEDTPSSNGNKAKYADVRSSYTLLKEKNHK